MPTDFYSHIANVNLRNIQPFLFLAIELLYTHTHINTYTQIVSLFIRQVCVCDGRKVLEIHM